MDINFSASSVTVKELERALGDSDVPEGLQAFVMQGAKALVKRFDKDTRMSVSVLGHLHTGEKGDAQASMVDVRVTPA